MIKLIKVEDNFINLDKIIQIYETREHPSSERLVTVIEIEGIQTGNTGPNGETPYYSQNQVRTRLSMDKVLDKISMINMLDELRKIARGS
ncbi:TPA: hypothetical protein U1U77_001877 [Streptococcus suis]|nr:hypothetical protein [Streptococcus suis]